MQSGKRRSICLGKHPSAYFICARTTRSHGDHAVGRRPEVLLHLDVEALGTSIRGRPSQASIPEAQMPLSWTAM